MDLLCISAEDRFKMSTLNGRCCWIKHRHRKWKIRAGALSAQGQHSTLQLRATGESYEALAHTSYKDQEKITLLRGLPALKTCPLTAHEHYNTCCCSTLSDKVVTDHILSLCTRCIRFSRNRYLCPFSIWQENPQGDHVTFLTNYSCWGFF